MAGAGFDARMIGDADGGLKDRFGRLAYVWTGAKHLREKPFRAKIKVDGARWYDGDASCILLGNVGKLFGGVEAFEDAHPDDGVLELGVVSADGVREWAGTVARAVVGTAASSPHAFTTKAHSVRIKLDRKVLYEIDGGDRKKTRKLARRRRARRRADLRSRCRSGLAQPGVRSRSWRSSSGQPVGRLGRAPADRERARRSSRSSTAIELSNVTGDTRRQLDIGTPDAGGARERPGDGAGGSRGQQLDDAPLARLERVAERRADDLEDAALLTLARARPPRRRRCARRRR